MLCVSEEQACRTPHLPKRSMNAFRLSKWELECSPVRWMVKQLRRNECTQRNSLDRNDRDTNYHHHQANLKLFDIFSLVLFIDYVNDFHFQRRELCTVYSPVFALLSIESKFCWRDFPFSGWFNFGCRLSILAKLESFARFLGIFILNSHTHPQMIESLFPIWSSTSTYLMISFSSVILSSLLGACILVCRSNFKVLTST